ncbi:MAG: antibiotic biosynthesis monooxygenase, partial [Myxococcota bacterium]
MHAVTISMRAKDLTAFRQLEQASIAVIQASRSEPGCLFFDVLVEHNDPLLLRFYEAYVDEQAFRDHLQAAHTKRWSEICIPLVDKSSIRLPESLTRQTSSPAKRIVVFGATGKIGTEMVKLLARDPRCHAVSALSREPGSARAQPLAPTATK